MKKGTKIALIIAAITIVLGIIILIATGIQIGNEGFREIFITTQNAVNDHIFDDDWDNDITFPDENITFPPSSIKNIEIDVDVAKLYINTGDEACFQANNVTGAQIICNLDNDGTLEIYDKHQHRTYNMFTGIKKTPTGILTLPKGTTLNELEIDCDVGEIIIDVEDLETLFLETSVQVGVVEITNITSNNSDISVDVGSVKINGTILGMNDMRCAIGEITITTKGQLEDYSYDVSNNLGSITINNNSTSGFINNASQSRKRNHFDLHCDLGDIIVEIND